MSVRSPQAEALKDEANVAFKEHHFEKAVQLYTKAIELDGQSAIYYSNRALAYIRCEKYQAGLEDADKAIELDPDYVKGYYRRATAKMATNHLKDALVDFKMTVKLEPNNPGARDKLKECQKLIKAEQFSRAISGPDKETAAAQMHARTDPSTIVVEESYNGPRLENDGPVTLEFVLAMMERFKKQQKIHLRYGLSIIYKVRELLRKESVLMDLQVPASSDKFTVCGDVHGQYYDLCNIFELNGLPSRENPYLFNGDFVDRGSFSVEVIFLLFAFKAWDNECIFLTRGNHETRNMNKIYGFEGELKAKYNVDLYELFSEVFCLLPLGAVINEKVLVVHGGLFSRDGVTLDDIRKIDRNMEPPDSGLMTEMLWSDPQPTDGRSPSKRGVGVAFGPDVTRRFLDDNKLQLLVRSHECKDNGYEVECDGRLITVFSAPNYCDQIGNKGAFINFGRDMVPKMTTFSHVPHPNVRPMAYAGSFNSMFGLFQRL